MNQLRNKIETPFFETTKGKIHQFLGAHIGSRWIQVLTALQTEHKFYALYGNFNFGESYKKKNIKNLNQESGKIHGAIIKFIESLPTNQTKNIVTW